MIRPRNLDPGQYPHPNHLIMGSCINDNGYWVAAGASLALATNPTGTFITLAASAARPLPTAQSIGIVTSAVATNGDVTFRVSGLNQFGAPIFQDILVPSGTNAGTIVGTATLVTTKVFRLVTAVQVLANANSAAATFQLGTVPSSAQQKIGVPVKLARVAEMVRLISHVALAGVFTTLGTTATVDLTNHAIIPGVLAFTSQGTLVIFQVNMNVNTGQRG